MRTNDSPAGGSMSADLSAAHAEPNAATSADPQTDTPSWLETAITVFLTMVAILLVSFISVATYL
jgi:hypothetical protein